MPFSGNGIATQAALRGHEIEVRALADGFLHDGQRFSSLSGVAERVTGTRWNGVLFFALHARNHAA